VRARWLAIAAVILGAATAGAQEEPDEAAPPPAPAVAPSLGGADAAARARWLAERIDAALAARPELGAARVGISVVDIASGRALYGHNSGERLKLASNGKIVTAIGALALLGPEYRFRTAILGDAFLPDGTVQGNLYLRGGGDPSLDTPALWALVNELKLLGVKKVTGALVVDDTRFDAEALPPHFDEKKEDAYFRAAISAASLNDNAVTVWIQPGKEVGAPARVTLDPASDYFVVKSTAATVAKGRTALFVQTRALPGQTEVTVSGAIRGDDLEGDAYRKRVEHPTLYLGATLRVLLAGAGIKIAEKSLKLQPVPKAARALVSRQSPPVGILVREMAKTSNNFVAEMLLKTIAVEVAGAPGTWEKGVAAVKRRLAELGIPEAAYQYDNGSGLYSSDFMPAETMTALLRLAARDFRYGPDLMASLAVAGADGTLGHRMVGGAAERHVRAKSGSLKGVSCLSGYAGGTGGNPLLAFAVLVNDIPDTPMAAAAARSLADLVAETLVRYSEAE
jgi:serine-type D-Ala-D-Ala carboxypeptidase/endopeptidase (penicillin-binding protein 4)